MLKNDCIIHLQMDTALLGKCCEVPTIDMSYSALGVTPVIVYVSVEPPVMLTLSVDPETVVLV